MLNRLLRPLRYRVERWMQRGALNQILVMMAIIAVVAISGGVLVFLGGAIESLPDAIWWSFLRLTDPGYLGDDEGLFLRIVSTAVTVLGYVLFMGSLIAIMTQWLRQRMQKLESGLTPIGIRGHILILGWTTRTIAIVRELLMSEGRVRRFLNRRNTSRLRVVVLTEGLDGALATEIREQLGAQWDWRKVILRSGSPLRNEHLRRVNAAGAAAIIIPGVDFGPGGHEVTDARTVKALMSISDEVAGAGGAMPSIVAEVFNENNAHIAERTYQREIEVIASDAFLSRLIAQNVRHPGLSFVYSELLSYFTGSQIYLRTCPDLAGQRMDQLRRRFPRAILLGVARPEGNGFVPMLNPPPSLVTEADDRYVLISHDYESAAPESDASGRSASPGRPDGQANPLPAPKATSERDRHRLLVLGWSRKVPSLLREFDSYVDEHFQIDILSLVPTARRERHIGRDAADLKRVSVSHLEGDYTVASELASVQPADYDTVVFLGSDWLQSGEESDARTVLGYVLYKSVIRGAARHPHIVVELIDPENARLFAQREEEVIISPLVLSHMLAHVALRRELHAVFEELFGPGGAEISFNPLDSYVQATGPLRFVDVQAKTAAAGETALGLHRSTAQGTKAEGLLLNPPADLIWTPSEGDQVVVLTTYARAVASPPVTGETVP